ncbi:Cytochrome b561 and DOMON domain-containing protein [Rhynchospora pubera]|uniref:Cytochrome b561 and DOMON domain-containing protein n=1 Tax=Rhynchospora pubera TaxID=906938 RepID=A0AAV8FUE8_9POAL|nr:Cytochrome b561 and DOMON domain-containing protein [Rhynchospora pubera]
MAIVTYPGPLPFSSLSSSYYNQISLFQKPLQPAPQKPFSENRLFASCIDLSQLSASLHWTYDPTNSTVNVAFTAPNPNSNGWVAWALNPAKPSMVGSQAIIALHDSDGKIVVRTSNISTYSGVDFSPIMYDVWGMEAEQGEIGGVSVMSFFASIKLPHGTTKMSHVWQVGPESKSGELQKHDFGEENLNSKGVMNFASDGVKSASSNSRLNERNVHGFILGTAGWGTGLNLGVKSKGVQYTTHRNIGITLFSLATLQVTALLLRPEKDHKYRKYWNLYHHTFGYTILVLGILNIFKGLSILNLGHKWEIIAIVIVGFFIGITLLLEITSFVRSHLRKKNLATITNPNKQDQDVQSGV